MDLATIYAPNQLRKMAKKDRKVQAGVKRVRVNLQGCGNTSKALMRVLVEKYGWEEIDDLVDCDLVWSDSNGAKPYFKQYKKFGKLNQLPDMHYLATKATLDRLLHLSYEIAPDDFGFFPKSWDLVYELRKFKSEFIADGRTYILKPSAGKQGIGICLAQKWSDVEKIAPKIQSMKYVAQEYIAEPLLLDGFKFDMRIYCLIESLKPMKVHLFRDGLARLCTTKYEKPNDDNLDKAYMHFTNYSLNKESETYVQVKQDTAATESLENEGSKRSISTAFAQLRRAKIPFNVEKFWKEVEDIVSLTCVTLWPGMWGSFCRLYPGAHDYAVQQQQGKVMEGTMPGSECFHIMGFDILIDGNFKPWLLEVNAAPSFGTGSVVDLRVKQSVVERTLDIVGIINQKDSNTHRRKMNQVKASALSVSIGATPTGSSRVSPSASGTSTPVGPDSPDAEVRSPPQRRTSFSRDGPKYRGQRRRDADWLNSDESKDPRKKERINTSTSYSKGIDYLAMLRAKRQRDDGRVKKDLPQAAYDNVNFTKLDYTCLRPAYTFRDIFLFGSPMLVELYGEYSTNYASGMTAAKFTRILTQYDVLDMRVISRADVELMYQKFVKSVVYGPMANSFTYSIFCELLLAVAVKIYRNMSPFRAFQSLLRVFRTQPPIKHT